MSTRSTWGPQVQAVRMPGTVRHMTPSARRSSDARQSLPANAVRSWNYRGPAIAKWQAEVAGALTSGRPTPSGGRHSLGDTSLSQNAVRSLKCSIRQQTPMSQADVMSASVTSATKSSHLSIPNSVSSLVSSTRQESLTSLGSLPSKEPISRFGHQAAVVPGVPVHAAFTIPGNSRMSAAVVPTMDFTTTTSAMASSQTTSPVQSPPGAALRRATMPTAFVQAKGTSVPQGTTLLPSSDPCAPSGCNACQPEMLLSTNGQNGQSPELCGSSKTLGVHSSPCSSSDATVMISEVADATARQTAPYCSGQSTPSCRVSHSSPRSADGSVNSFGERVVTESKDGKLSAPGRYIGPVLQETGRRPSSTMNSIPISSSYQRTAVVQGPVGGKQPALLRNVDNNTNNNTDNRSPSSQTIRSQDSELTSFSCSTMRDSVPCPI